MKEDYCKECLCSSCEEDGCGHCVQCENKTNQPEPEIITQCGPMHGIYVYTFITD